MRVSSELKDKNDTGHTAAIGVIASITRLITVTALFHVVTVLILLMTSSARRRVVRGVSVTLSTSPARCTRVLLSIGRPPWINSHGAITDVSCMVSVLVWAVGRTALPSGIGILAATGLRVLTAAVREELVFADTVTIRKTVTGSGGCPACPSALRKIISSSACTTISQMYE
jgi:hypothetical protein